MKAAAATMKAPTQNNWVLLIRKQMVQMHHSLGLEFTLPSCKSETIRALH